MSSKYVDYTAAMQVIGATYLNPQLLDYTDKYQVVEEDFAEPFHRIVFGAIYKLHELGTEKMSLAAISDFLASRPKFDAIFKENKGQEWIVEVVSNAQINSFDYYYHRLKKFTLLRAYDSFGIDVSDILDMDNVFDTKKRQEQEERLDNLDLLQIADMVDEKIDRIRLDYVNDSTAEPHMAGEGLEALIARFKEHPEVGVPLYGPLINTVTRGARLKKFYLRSAPTGCGMAIPNDTIIPTPSGYRRVGDIAIGDYLFGADGNPTKVLAVHPQPVEKYIWQIHFEDGRVAQCCREHLWEYYIDEYEDHVCDTADLYHKIKEEHLNVSVKLNHPVYYSEKTLSEDPYKIGAMSDEELIPEEYLTAGIHQRISLLSGLIDSIDPITDKYEAVYILIN